MRDKVIDTNKITHQNAKCIINERLLLKQSLKIKFNVYLFQWEKTLQLKSKNNNLLIMKKKNKKKKLSLF